MLPNELYAIGTLLTWAGWFFAVGAGLAGVRLLLNDPGADRGVAIRSLVISLVTAGILLGIGASIPMSLEKPEPGIHVPVVWFVMPFSAWGLVFCIGFAVARGIQAWMALNSEERIRRLWGGGALAVGAAIFLWLYRRDATNEIVILKGAITLSPTVLGALLLMAIASVFAMILADRATKTRGIAKTVAVQIALLAGSVVFGIPFLFLLITSFKEDQDMSSPNGIVWIPKVTDQLPYMDKKHPLYEATYNGQTVQGTMQGRSEADHTVSIDVEKPFALAGSTFQAPESAVKEVPRYGKVLSALLNGTRVQGLDIEDLDNGSQRVQIMTPVSMKGHEHVFLPSETEAVRHVGLRWQNYPEALSYLPPETNNGLVYLKNTLLIVVMSVIGTVLSSSIVAYAFSRLNFPGRNALFYVLLSTMMLPGAVTLMPQFLIFRYLHWINTLYPIWVPAFFASAFNVFLLRQFFMQIPMELEDASKIDGASYLRTFWQVMLPQIKPALAVIAIWTFMGAWNNFMGPLIYVNSPENMPLSYALQLFQGDRSGEPGLLMAFATLTMVPVLLLFFFAQRYFIEGVTLSGLGGR